MKQTVALSPETFSALEELKAPDESLDDVIRRLAVLKGRPRLEDDESAVC